MSYLHIPTILHHLRFRSPLLSIPFPPPLTFTILLQETFFTLALYALYHFFSRPNSKFPQISGPPRETWFKGNLGQLFTSKGLPFHQELVDKYGGIARVYGFFGDEQLYISDPRALHSITVKEQDAFEETAVFIETNKTIFGPGLVATTGAQHKAQRKLVAPTFAVPHLRRLTPLFYNIAEKLATVLEHEVHQRDIQEATYTAATLDISEWMSRVALETVGRAVLGYSFDPLDSPHNNPYTSAVKELIPTLFSLSLVRQLAPFLSRLGPPSFRRKLVEWIPNGAVQRVKEMADVMHETAVSILKERRQGLEEESLQEVEEELEGKDIISVLLRENARASEGEKMSDRELTGQMTVLIFGAQDTTSSALSRILYMLAMNPEVQERVWEEVVTAIRTKGDRGEGEEGIGRLGYDEVSGLPWLDAVVKETLRLYPPVPFVRRTAVREVAVPYVAGSAQLGSNNMDNDNDESSIHEVSYVTIPKGTTIFVSILGSNRLEKVWGPDAKSWKPQRWIQMDGESMRRDKDTRLPGIYAGMMSFLGGGRSCVGYKFALIEIKIILVTLLTRFKFALAEEKGTEIVWNMSQIISPSVRNTVAGTEHKGMPLRVLPRRRVNEL
ncbi:hypothetical protein AMATHDRAFT_153366 [Amanita thiersii Skay4041]|uniref:Cytochrome P450 n=1 Tax=Amanita thiersii Skay4041 TaxID=703135 RepID=A0A2A9N8W4_9AGAR|nr:hypothetical protein AMATHDRAFT_153366 [Amanita thiersii Skay4041]